MTTGLKKMLEGYDNLLKRALTERGEITQTGFEVFTLQFMRQVIVELEGIDKGAVRAFDAIAEEMDTVITRLTTLEAPSIKPKFEPLHKYCKEDNKYDPE